MMVMLWAVIAAIHVLQSVKRGKNNYAFKP